MALRNMQEILAPADVEAKKLEETKTKAAPVVMYITVTADLLNLRDKPDGNVLNVLKKGTKLKVVKKSKCEGWTEVVAPDSVKGFVMAKFCE